MGSPVFESHLLFCDRLTTNGSAQLTVDFRKVNQRRPTSH
jgi:hypothetical protein